MGSLELIFKITADSTGAQNAIKQFRENLNSEMRQVGASLQSVGATLTAAITAPILGVAAASIKLAGDYEASMSKVRGLTDTTAKDFEHMNKSVLEMSKTLPQSAKELADGLFFVVSAGLKGDEALNVLKVSAKAAAAGLGETKTVADAVTPTLNAYKLGANQASHVTDILTNAVVQGKVVADTLAPALGKVLPVAAAAGVNFEQVAASMATMTRVGLTASEAATALRGILGAIEKPGKQAQTALAGIGFSADSLRQSLSDRGLLGTLQILMERTHGNVGELGKIIPNIRALTGVLATAGSQGEAYSEILDSMNHSTGRTEKAFQTAAQTFVFQSQVFRNELEAVGIVIGNALMPRPTPLLHVLGQALPPIIEGLVHAFQSLPESMSGAILAFTAVVVAAGPVLAIIGTIIVAVSTIGAPVAIAAAEIVAALALAAAAATALYAAYQSNFGGIKTLVETVFGGVRELVVGARTEVVAFSAPLLQQLYDVIGSKLNSVRQVVEEETKIIVDFWKENWPLIKQTVEHVLSDIKIIVGAVLKVIQVFWQEHGEAIKAIVHSAWEIVKTISVTGLKIILDVIKLGMQIYNDNWRGAWETTKNIGSLAVHAVGQIVRGLVNILFEIIKDIARAIINAVVDLGRRAEALGHAIIDGMVRGIKSGISAVINAAKDMGSAAITAAKAMLRSQSPSQVFHEIGRDVAQGFINGIQSSKAAVQNVMRELVAAPSLQGVSLGKLKPPQLSRAAGIAEGDEERRFKTETDAAKRAFAERTLADEQYVGRLIKADERLLNSKLTVIAAERAEARTTIADQNEFALKLAELRSREADHVAEHKATVQQIVDEKNGRARDAALAHQRALDAIAEMAAAREIERIKGLAELGYISEVVVERRLQELREEGFAREQKALDKELAAATENLAEHQRITDELTVLDARRAASAEQAMRRIIAASNKQIEGSLPDSVPGLPAVQTPQKTQKKGRRQSAAADNNFGLPDAPKIKETETAMQGITRALGEVKAIGQEAFGQLAQGAGQMLSNWILLGDAGPQALRKMTAQILASLSAQAAVEAIMETARGLAALANPLLAWTAPGHFAAAAVFASVAGVAAIAGRGLAGDLFKTDARGANGGKQKDSNVAGGRALGNGANGGTSTASRQATIIEENRRTPPIQVIQNPEMIAAVKSLSLEVKTLRAELGDFHNKLSSMRPEDVVSVGTKRRPETVTDAIHTEYHGYSTKLNNVLQDASKRSW